MTKKFTKGFTLIELLVVIAIIGILSSIVLASLNTARGKGSDAAVKSAMDSMRAQAELSYDSSGQTYANVCADPVVAKALTNIQSNSGATAVVATNAAQTASTVACDNAAGSWVIAAPLKGAGGYWCVDSSSNEKAETGVTGAAATVCP